MDESAGVATEPVRVRRISDTQVRAEGWYEELRAELRKRRPCTTQRDVDAVAGQVALRIQQMPADLRDALLFSFLVTDIRSGPKPAAVIPEELLAERIALRT